MEGWKLRLFNWGNCVPILIRQGLTSYICGKLRKFNMEISILFFIRSRVKHLIFLADQMEFRKYKMGYFKGSANCWIDKGGIIIMILEDLPMIPIQCSVGQMFRTLAILETKFTGITLKISICDFVYYLFVNLMSFNPVVIRSSLLSINNHAKKVADQLSQY